MKKFICLLGCLVAGNMLVGLPNVNVQASAEEAEQQYVAADYVSYACAPTIDGIISEGEWVRTYAAETLGGAEGISATISIMWNETNLYFLAEVQDSTLNNSDLCNFWVSETYYARENKFTYNYPNTPGSYYLCLNPQGENKYYLPSDLDSDSYVDMRGKYTVATSTTENSYIIELCVPLMGNKILLAYDCIGFEVSVDNYLDENSARDCYTNCFDKGPYWETPTALGQVVLLDFVSENGSPVSLDDADVPPLDDDKDSSSSSDKDSASNSTPTQSNDKNFLMNFGCQGSVGTALIPMFVGFMMIAEKLGKKRK